MTTDFASALAGIGLAVLLVGVTWVFGAGWALVVAGAILLLAGVSAHLNGRETVAAVNGDGTDAA